MRAFLCGLAMLASPSLVMAQRGGRQSPDSARADSARLDSLIRVARTMHAVNIVAAPLDPKQPLTVTHVPAVVLRSMPSSNTWDALRLTAGIEVHQQGQGPGFASDASLRGFSSDHSTDIALWIDGVPVNEPINGHAEGYNDFSELFTSAVQNIDVIKGPTSPLFGNFALGGVVNVHTLERMDGTQVTLQSGSYGNAGATLLSGFDHGASGGGVFGIHFQHDDGFRPNAGYNIEQGHGRFVHDLGGGWTLDAGTELYGANWNSAGFLSSTEFANQQYDIVSNPTDGGYKRHAQERVSLRLLTGNMLWRTTLYGTQGDWQLFLTIPPAGGVFEGSGSQTEERDRRSGAGLTSALTWQLPHGEMTLGAEGRWNHAHYRNWFTTARTRDSTQVLLGATQTSGAVFVQSYVNATQRLRVDLGGRADILATTSMEDGGAAHNGSTGVLSPKLGASYRLARTLTAYANLARGFRATDGVIEDPTLPVITAWDYEGGLKWERAANSVSATVFRMNVSNEQTFNPLTGDANSGGSSRRQGLELQWSLRVQPSVLFNGDWTFNDARYTHLTIIAEDGGEPPAQVDGLRVYNSAKYIGSASLQYAPLLRSWSVRLSGSWLGPYSPFDEPGVVLGAYGLMQVDATVHIAGNELDAGVRNVFSRRYPELVAGGLVSPGQPRALFVKLRRSF